MLVVVVGLCRSSPGDAQAIIPRAILPSALLPFMFPLMSKGFHPILMLPVLAIAAVIFIGWVVGDISKRTSGATVTPDRDEP